MPVCHGQVEAENSPQHLLPQFARWIAGVGLETKFAVRMIEFESADLQVARKPDTELGYRRPLVRRHDNRHKTEHLHQIICVVHHHQ